jgi:hypothetical protein
MFQFKSQLPPLITALAMVALTGSAGSAKADIIFGNFASPPGPGTSVAASNHADAFVANNTQAFLSNGVTFTATGFSGAPGGTTAALTLKTSGNGFGESGLGENTGGPPTTACSDSDCEIAGSASVGVVASSAVIHDVIVGSVQATEGFQIWTGTVSGSTVSWSTSGSPIFGGTSDCVSAGTDTCEVIFPSLVQAVAVQNNTTNAAAGDVLLTELSAVPAPAIGHGLLVLLAVAGVLFGGKLLEHGKRRSSLETA